MSTPDEEPTVDNLDQWCNQSNDLESEEEYDFRYLKIHPVLAGIIKFFLLLPIFLLGLIIVVGAFVLEVMKYSWLW